MSGNKIPSVEQPAAVDEFDPVLLGLGQTVIARFKGETVRESCGNHWRAIVWSAVLSTALYMEGYDTGLVSAALSTISSTFC